MTYNREESEKKYLVRTRNFNQSEEAKQVLDGYLKDGATVVRGEQNDDTYLFETDDIEAAALMFGNWQLAQVVTGGNVVMQTPSMIRVNKELFVA